MCIQERRYFDYRYCFSLDRELHVSLYLPRETVSPVPRFSGCRSYRSGIPLEGSWVLTFLSVTLQCELIMARHTMAELHWERGVPGSDQRIPTPTQNTVCQDGKSVAGRKYLCCFRTDMNQTWHLEARLCTTMSFTAWLRTCSALTWVEQDQITDL